MCLCLQGRGTSKRSQFPGFRYSSNATGDFISVPQGFQFPFPKQTYKPYVLIQHFTISKSNSPDIDL